MIEAKLLGRIRELLGACPWLTDEEIEASWECIDKQIPHKPEMIASDFWEDHDNNKECPYCACCGEELNRAEGFCPECGQAIDWSVSE